MSSCILLINPNTSLDMTRRIAEEARRSAPAHVKIKSVTAPFGPSVIASRASFAIAAHAALECFARHSRHANAVIVACFGDPGVLAIRELTCVPVIGLADASVRAAGRMKRRFAIVTAGLVWKSMLTEFVSLTPQSEWFGGVYCIDTTGIAVSRDPDHFMSLLADQIERARSDGAETVVLGGAAFAGFASRLNCKVPLIDCVAAAVAEAVDLKHSLPYAASEAPPPITTIGLSDDLSELMNRGADRP